MAYNGANLSIMHETFDGNYKSWVYDTADAINTVTAAGYISDATSRGMNPGEVVLVRDTATWANYWCTVLAVTAGAADLSDGLAIGTANTY